MPINPGEVPARLEALGAPPAASIGAALHSQLAAGRPGASACRPGPAGPTAGWLRLLCCVIPTKRVRAVTVWHADRGMTDDAGDLYRFTTKPVSRMNRGDGSCRWLWASALVGLSVVVATGPVRREPAHPVAGSKSARRGGLWMDGGLPHFSPLSCLPLATVARSCGRCGQLPFSRHPAPSPNAAHRSTRAGNPGGRP